MDGLANMGEAPKVCVNVTSHGLIESFLLGFVPIKWYPFLPHWESCLKPRKIYQHNWKYS